MNEFEKIIGYSDIKKELEQLADILKGNELYKKLGVKVPKGLLLYGEPGLGKTLMANCLIRASGRIWYTCRKDLPKGEFVKHLRETFQKAKNAAPSIVFLDDMDKFANGDELHRNAEEYVTVQSCIDSVKDCDVFVVATANDKRNMPDSLLRAGRFDRVLEVDTPFGEDAEAIMSHYTKGRALAEDIDKKLIVRLLEDCTCAELETVINEAGLYAGFERSEVITQDHFVKACLKLVHRVSVYGLNNIGKKFCDNEKRLVAYHEAGHAVIAEVMNPGGVSLAAIYKNHPEQSYSGFVTSGKPLDAMPFECKEIRILTALGGKAAVESVLGVHDVGSIRDVDQAFSMVGRMVRYTCIAGFQHYSKGETEDSQQLMFNQELSVATKVEEYYRKTQKILAENRTLLDRIAAELMEKDVLTMNDITRIKSELSDRDNAA